MSRMASSYLFLEPSDLRVLLYHLSLKLLLGLLKLLAYLIQLCLSLVMGCLLLL